MGTFRALKIDSFKPLREQVFDSLQESILKGELEPEEQLTEVQISKALGVSRTPVREAIWKLELQGLVKLIPRRGIFVSGITSVDDIRNLFEVREILERETYIMAADRISKEELEELRQILKDIETCIQEGDLARAIEIDSRFHQIICQACGNPYLNRLVSSLREQVERFRVASLLSPGRFSEAFNEHKILAEAITKSEQDELRAIASRHIVNAKRQIMKFIKMR